MRSSPVRWRAETTLQALWDRDAVILADTVSANPGAFAGVTKLDLRRNGIGDSGLAALEVVLHGRALPHLADLALAHNALRAPSAARVAAALLRTARGLAGSLRRLAISGNPLGCGAPHRGRTHCWVVLDPGHTYIGVYRIRHWDLQNRYIGADQACFSLDRVLL